MSDNLFRVLSVDFDFFQNVTKNQLRNYPDGIDLPTKTTEIIWSIKYAEDKYRQEKDNVRNVKLYKTLYKQLLTILRKQNPEIPVLFANSHIHTYDFIAENHDNRKIELYNIDFHHDIINDNPKLDCGNWIKFLIDNYPVHKAYWITRKQSVKIYGFTQKEIEQMHISFDFSRIKDLKFDAVSICRSDTWTPPHLDCHFDEILKICQNHFENIRAEKNIMQPRTIHKIEIPDSNILKK